MKMPEILSPSSQQMCGSTTSNIDEKRWNPKMLCGTVLMPILQKLSWCISCGPLMDVSLDIQWRRAARLQTVKCHSLKAVALCNARIDFNKTLLLRYLTQQSTSYKRSVQ